MEDLYIRSEIVHITSPISFGKRKGIPISGIARDCNTWLLNQDNGNSYLRKALEN